MTENKGRGAKAKPGLRLFGGRTRTGVLLVLALLEETYPRELARILNTSLSGVQLAVDGLERDGVVTSRRLGTARRVMLDPKFPGANQLKNLLLELANRQPELVDAIRAERGADGYVDDR